MTQSYAEFRDDLLARHQHPLTSALSTIGDVLPIAGMMATAATRNPRWLAGGFLVGVGAAVSAHLFQPGTIRGELHAIATHPAWAARAEAERVRGGGRLGTAAAQ